MTFKTDLINQVDETLTGVWDEQSAIVVPSAESLRLNSNHAKHLESATVLYADLDGSTNMVDKQIWFFSAEIYKCYLRCASQIIKNQGGVITAYDGDRVMAIFTGDYKNTNAVRAAMMINYAVINIIRPAILRVYSNTEFILNHVVGIDTSALRAARIGIKGDNDIVWVGRAANYAAKLSSLGEGSIWITQEVFSVMADVVKYSSNNTFMWEKRVWTPMNNHQLYRCNWTWNF